MDATQALALTEKLYQKLLAQREKVERFDDYYEGKHPLKFASREWADFHKNRYQEFADNWCGVVVDALNERLRVSDLRVTQDSSNEERALWAAMQRAEFAIQSSQGFLQTITSSTSSALVWPDRDGTPTLAWEHPSEMYVRHEAATGRATAALKAWTDDEREYATLYTPEAIWKWQRRGDIVITKGQTRGGVHVSVRSIASIGTWEPRQDADDNVWPVPNKLGVLPVVDVPNRPRLKRGPISDISGVMAMQDALNLLWSFLFSSADHASLSARVVLGAKPPMVPILDAEGQVVGQRPVDMRELAHDRLFFVEGENAKIAQWDAADLTAFTKVIEVAIGHISSQNRIPAHYFISNSGLSNINGETLIATETPLVKKAEEFQLFTSGRIAQIAALFARIQGEAGLADSLSGSAIKWANPAIRSEAQLADALTKWAGIGYPFEYLMELHGVSPEDRTRILEMRKAEQSDPDVAAIVDRLGNASAFGG